MRPFHQVVRYETARCAVEAARTKPVHTILEVGSGSHGNLASFLPDDQILFLDSELTEDARNDPRFLLGDATDLPFEDGSFDFVIALDVLEHIKPEKRETFLQQICRVAKYGVLLLFPHFSPDSPIEDEKLKTFYLAAGGEPPVWVDEHIDCTLPAVDWVKGCLERLPGDSIHMYGVRRSLMQKMLHVEAASACYPEMAGFFSTVSREYVASVLYHDLGEDGSRSIKSCFLIRKEGGAEAWAERFRENFWMDLRLLDSFERFVTEGLTVYFQLENLRMGRELRQADEGLLGQLELVREQLARDFEVLNGRSQQSFGDVLEQLRGVQGQLSGSFDVLNGRSQQSFGDVLEQLRGVQGQLSGSFDVLNGRSQQSFGDVLEQLGDVLGQLSEVREQSGKLLPERMEQLKRIGQEGFHAVQADAETLRGQLAADGESLLREARAARGILERAFPDSPVLSVILITYNQAAYIEETVRSLLGQKTDFRFQVLVADDCSTDDTVERIRSLSEGSPIPFLFLQSEHNLGIMKNYKRAFAAADTEFTAILEGDDFWTDPLRLQKHVDFLRAHSECSMSFNRYIVKNFETGDFHLQPRFSAEDEQRAYCYISGHDLAYDNLIGNFSTCVYRQSCLRALPEELFDMDAYDWLTNILVSKMGYIGCLMQATSIYRIHGSGVWSGQDPRQQAVRLIESIDRYNQFTAYEFTNGFTAFRGRLTERLRELDLQEKMETVIPQEETRRTVKDHLKQLLRRLYRASRWVPPLLLVPVRWLVPKAVQERLKRAGGGYGE